MTRRQRAECHRVTRSTCRGQQFLARVAAEDQVELPGEVRGVPDARTHALAREGRHLVRGVTGQQRREHLPDRAVADDQGATCARMYGAPYLTVHRAHLHTALLDLAGSARLRLGHRPLDCADAGPAPVRPPAGPVFLPVVGGGGFGKIRPRGIWPA
jgi:hypothetical protein